MTSDRGPGWNKILAVGSAFGLPLLGMAYAGVVALTKLDDKVGGIVLKQQEQGMDIKDIKSRISTIEGRVDTISRRQDNNQRDNNYRFLMWEHGVKSTKP